MHMGHSFEGDAIPRKYNKPNKMEKKQQISVSSTDESTTKNVNNEL